MGKLIDLLSASLDGYIEDEAGNFDWGAPDEEPHRYINDLQRKIGTVHLSYGIARGSVDYGNSSARPLFTINPGWQLRQK